MDYLIFRLYGPMASWGEIAVGETRHTASYSGKSAIIGLLSAALGIKRDDLEKQQLMQQDYLIAVEVISQGALLKDYHTAQVPDSVGNFNYCTRRDELVIGKERLGTILSSREYRTDSFSLIAIKALPAAIHDLQSLKNFLHKPVFHLYLGRKSCPLSIPMDPQVIENKSNFYEAFRAYKHRPIMPTNKSSESSISDRDSYWLMINKDRHYYWEGEADDFSDTLDLSRMQTRVRYDQPLSRIRWQFSTRQEHYFHFQGDE